MKTRFLFLILFATSCRDGHFDSRPLSSEESTLQILPEESSSLGVCEQKENCFRLQIPFTLKNKEGLSIPDQEIKLELSHGSRVLSGPLVAKTNSQGVAEFIVEFMELPIERGQSFLTAFHLSLADRGSKTFCALVEPSRSKTPIHSFKECKLEYFQPLVYGEKPSFSFDVIDTVVLDSRELGKGIREISARASFRAYDRKLREPAIELPVKWNLEIEGKKIEGFSKTDALGEFDLDFSLPFSPFKNEKNYVANYSIEAIGSEGISDHGFLFLNFERNSIRPLVSKGKYKKPGETTQLTNSAAADQVQTLDLKPIVFQRSSDQKPLTLSNDLLPISSLSYLFQFRLSMSRSRLTQPTELVPLSQIPVDGKIFLAREGINGLNVFHESVLSGLLDGNGDFLAQLNFDTRFFVDTETSWKILVAVSLPHFDSVPSAYFEIRIRENNQFVVVPLKRENAEKILGNRLLNLLEPTLSSETPEEIKAEKYFEGIPVLDSQLVVEEPWFNVYESFFPGKMKASEAKTILPQYLQIQESYWEILPSEISFVPERGVRDVTIDGEEFREERFKFIVSGSGRRCLWLQAQEKGGNEEIRRFHRCSANASKFSGFDSFWTLLRMKNFPNDVFLLSGWHPKGLNLAKIREQNLFQNLQGYPIRMLSRPLFPKN